MWATGCRPAEIERGVTIRRDGDALVIEIPGAKVTADKGQPIRRIAVDPASEVGRIIAMMLGTTGRPRSKESQAHSGRFRGHPPPFRIGGDFGLQLQASVGFGHEGRGDDPVKIAEALKHASTRTQSRYGSPSKGHKGGPIIGAEATGKSGSAAIRLLLQRLPRA